MSDPMNTYHDDEYFRWQAPVGAFGGWANRGMFIEYMSSHSRVLDFGCGGRYLLKGMDCSKKVGVEVNASAIETARKNGLEMFTRVEDMPDEYVDVVISDNALEHTLQPLEELRSLRKKLKTGGKIIFVVPCESVSYSHKPNDVNHHLYGWSPMCIGNLFTEAGFSVIESRPYIHKWPPYYGYIARVGGRRWFDRAARISGRIERSWFQVRGVAETKGA